MRVFLTGANGFIGGHILHALVSRGDPVTCLVRGRGEQAIRSQNMPGVQIAIGEFTEPDSWLRHLHGHEAVVNAIGIIRQTSSASFQAVHQRAPIALFEAAARLPVRKIVQISALGADEKAASQYHLTKRAADIRLSQLGVPYVVLRPSIVFGPGDHSMTYFQSLAALPLTLVPGDGSYRLQPILVDDLVRAVVVGLECDTIENVVLDVGGAESVSFDELLDILARRLEHSRSRKLHIPWPLMQMIARITDQLGGRGPITTEELSMLRRGNTADNRPFVKQFGFEPVSLAAGLARYPLSQAQRWHARVSPLRIPLRLSVAFIWLATGYISAFVSTDQGFDLLRQIGITGAWAGVALYGTCLLEILLGLATAVGWRVRVMGIVQLFLMFGFMLILTFRMPDLWLHPFGPLTKNIPVIGATLLMMALEE